VDRLYGGDAAALPPGAVLVRFALKPGAAFPDHPRVVSIHGIGEEGFDPPGKRQAEALAGLGIGPGLEAGSKKTPEEIYNNIKYSFPFPGLPESQAEEAQTGSGPGGQAGSGSEVHAPLGQALPEAPKEWFPGSLAAFREAFGGVAPGAEETKALDGLWSGSPAALAPAPEAVPDSGPDPAPLPALALLFPGAGHPAKAWPLVQYFELARRLPELGFSPVFVLGPAEIERGMDAGGYPQVRPGSLPALTGLLNRAGLVVGNDSGPLHLAGMLGRPAVGLFGPSSRRQWGPPGVAALARTIPCRPCTRTTAGLACPEPVCLAGMDVDTVLAAVRRVLARPETANP
jgi:hypothetical protein